MEKRPLTTKQSEYLGHRVAGLTQRQAYLRAYPSSQRWLPASVDNKAHLLEKDERIGPVIKEQRQRALDEAIEEGRVSTKDIVSELSRVGHSNIIDLASISEVDDVIAGIPREKLAAVSSIKITKDGVEFKLHNKTRALELLGRHTGMFEQNPNSPDFAKDIEDLTPLAEMLRDDNTDTDD